MKITTIAGLGLGAFAVSRLTLRSTGATRWERTRMLPGDGARPRREGQLDDGDDHRRAAGRSLAMARPDRLRPRRLLQLRQARQRRTPQCRGDPPRVAVAEARRPSRVDPVRPHLVRRGGARSRRGRSSCVLRSTRWRGVRTTRRKNGRPCSSTRAGRSCSSRSRRAPGCSCGRRRRRGPPSSAGSRTCSSSIRRTGSCRPASSSGSGTSRRRPTWPGRPRGSAARTPRARARRR